MGRWVVAIAMAMILAGGGALADARMAAGEMSPVKMGTTAVQASDGETLLAQNRKPRLTQAQREQKLAQWRAARHCAIFHYNRMERFTQQGNAGKAEEAELDWGDWDDVALDIETELDMEVRETLAVEDRMEAEHKAQIARAGWAGYEQAWAGKCREAP